MDSELLRVSMNHNDINEVLAVVSNDAVPDYIAQVCGSVDKVWAGSGPHNMVLNASEFDDMIGDKSGNEAKMIVSDGVVVHGVPPAIYGDVMPIRPATLTVGEIEYNLSKYGFWLLGLGPREIMSAKTIRPEYLIAGMVFDRHARRHYAGIPVVMYNAPINWGFLIYLSIFYRFAETLLGFLINMDKLERLPNNAKDAISILYGCNVKPKIMPINDTKKALDVYGCR